MFLAKLCPSLSIIWKLLWLVVWPVIVLWWWIAEGAFRCSLYLSPKVLEVSPMYSSSQPRLLHWYLYMAPLWLSNNSAQPANHGVQSKGHIVIPYTQGLCESIKKICGRYGIQTHFKGGKTIKNLLVSPKDKDPYAQPKWCHIQVPMQQPRLWWMST